MVDPLKSAKDAGLKYVTNESPGFGRKRKGKGFIYLDEHGKILKNKNHLLRIKELVIPPAWEDVWICKHDNGHLQVTGRDARGRKQYRYHEKWNLHRNENKFHHLKNLSKKIPLLKKQIQKDLKLRGMPQDKVLAAVIKVMMLTQVRVGNAAYAEENDSYGLTTILNKHAKVKGETTKFYFRGKSGVEHDLALKDRKLSSIIKRCQELPGEELFTYINENNESVDVTSNMVNDYIHRVTGDDFTAKDLRTWGGTCKAIECLVKECPGKLSENKWHLRHVGIIKETAKHLRNTVSVCRKYYVHPIIFEADQKGSLHKIWKACRKSRGLEREELLLVKLLSH